MNIKKGDKVVILTGKDKGKKGKVDKVLIQKNKVVIGTLNIYKKHIKPTQLNPQGGISNISAPIAVSNIALICPRCEKQTKTKKSKIKNKTFRLCKLCKESLDK